MKFLKLFAIVMCGPVWNRWLFAMVALCALAGMPANVGGLEFLARLVIVVLAMALVWGLVGTVVFAGRYTDDKVSVTFNNKFGRFCR